MLTKDKKLILELKDSGAPWSVIADRVGVSVEKAQAMYGAAMKAEDRETRELPYPLNTLSMRVQNLLIRAGLTDLEALSKSDLSVLNKVPGFGPGSRRELRKVLDKEAKARAEVQGEDLGEAELLSTSSICKQIGISMSVKRISEFCEPDMVTSNGVYWYSSRVTGIKRAIAVQLLFGEEYRVEAYCCVGVLPTGNREASAIFWGVNRQDRGSFRRLIGTLEEAKYDMFGEVLSRE